MSSLTIHLLGPFRIWRDDELIPPEAWPTQKTKSLLKILITERGHVVAKERLIALLWQDLAPASAANSLRVGISHLRRMLEPELERPADSTFILTRSEGYCFPVTRDCWIDVDAFWDAVARGQYWARRRRWGLAIAAFRKAEDLYHGDYLEEDPYEDWAIGVRERTREAYLDALAHLAECLARIGQYHQAAAKCEKILANDPVRESIYRQLMVYQYRLGRRAQALRTYERCRQVLLERLGVNPMSQTQALHTKILREEPLEGPDHFRRPPPRIEGSTQPLPARLPFVGRGAEMDWLREHLAVAMSGRGRLVLISGEAGVGKTRLVEEFLALAKERGAQVFQGQCHELEDDLPYQPIREALQPYLLRHLAPERARQILGPAAPHLARLAPEVRELVPNLPRLEPLPAEEERQRMLAGLVQFCRSLASRYPLVFFLDDLQWSDPSTLQCLHMLARHTTEGRVLILGAFRDEEIDPDHPLRVLEQHLTVEGLANRLELRRLSLEAIAALIEQKAVQEWDSRPFIQQLYAETEGNPLFLAELLHSLLEDGLLLENEAGRWQPAPDVDLTDAALGLPATVQSIIENRCQAAGEAAQQILDIAAVIGRSFRYDLLKHTGDLNIHEKVDALDELLSRQLLRERTEAEQAEYAFSHDKIREAVYDGLSQARLIYLHRQVAEALAGVYEGRTEAVAGRLAHHFAEAGEAQKAAAYRLQAGNEALRLSAHEEAIRHLTEGLALLETLPDAPERAGQELDLQMALGTALMATRGYGAPELERAHDRALELCRQVKDLPRLSLVLTRLWTYYYIRGKLRTAHDLAQQFLQQARQSQDTIPLLEIHYLEMGITLLWMGDPAAARPYMEEALARHDPEQRDLSLSTYACDSRVLCLAHMALLLWTLGYPDQARQRIEQALSAARELDHPFSLAFAHIHAARVYHLRREYRLAYEQAGAAVALAGKHGFAQFEAVGLILRGGTQAQPTAADIAQVQRGLDFTLDIGREVAPPSFLALLAEAHARAGQLDEGLEVLAEALTAADTTEERWYEAELHRMKGELMLAHGDAAAAEQSFQIALEVGRRQQARLFELRTAVGLGRLWQQQGRQQEAWELVATCYGWFSEGFETPDLKEARALLEETS
ncbi:MAG TPA: AAA family ATPase [Anaerolineae bacterium]